MFIILKYLGFLSLFFQLSGKYFYESLLLLDNGAVDCLQRANPHRFIDK